MASKKLVQIRAWITSKVKTAPWLIIGMVFVVGAQLTVVSWRIIRSEWIIANGITVKLAVEASDVYDPFRGNYFGFIPTLFRHSFPSGLPIFVGDQVIVGALNNRHSDWAILESVPTDNMPYYRVTVQSANDGQFFLSPPFRRMYLDDEAKAAVLAALTPRGPKVPICLVIKHHGDRSILEGIQVGNQVYLQP